MKLQDYDFELHHILGKTNTKADILSRKDQVDTQDDNKDIQMLKEELWTSRIMVEVTMLQRNKMVEETNLLEEIQWNRTKKKEIVQELKKEDSQSWKDNEIVYMDRKIYIPNNRKFWEQVLWKNHNPMDIGHSGQQMMLELIKWNYWWPGIKENIKKYVQECIKYQQNKVQH